MDASLFRAVVLMSMLVLAIAQSDINPSYTNAVPNGNTLGQVDDVSDPSNTNHMVPNGHLIPCAQNHASASCKHQRRKCDETCEMAAYFPASRYSEFQNAHKIFGVSNIQKIMAMAAPDQRQAAAEAFSGKGMQGKMILCMHLELCKEKEELAGEKNQSKEEDLQHDQSDGLNFPSPILPDRVRL
ncbi:unnamed protein product [Prunus armeniaca]